MKRSRTTFALALCLASTPAFAAHPYCKTTYWTPASIVFQERLPNTSTPPGVDCMITEFSVNDWSWKDKISLPHEFKLLDIINNATYSGKTLEIHDSIWNVPGKPLKLAAGRSIFFSSRIKGQPAIAQDRTSLSPSGTLRWQIPRNSEVISIIDLRDNKYASELILPPDGKAFDSITIENNSTLGTAVLGAHTPFPDQHMDLAPGNVVRVEFDPIVRKWMWAYAPYKEKRVKDHYKRIAPRTVMELKDGDWVSPVVLPSYAHDRDRVIVRSSATWDSEIRDSMDAAASTQFALRRGDEYEFVFAADKNRWHLLRQPSPSPAVETTYQKEVRLKDEGYGVIEVTAPSGGSTTPNVILPKPRKGLRVIAVGHPATTMNIIADNLNVPVLNDEKIAFRVNDRGLWERETTTIDLLWVLDMSSREIPYRWDALTLMRENIRQANDALENSGATFRYRLVGSPIEGFNYPGVDLKRVPEDLARDSNLQALLKQHRADGIYYGGSNRWGSAATCDWSHTSYTEKTFVIATALTCPTSTFRRRAGFALGVPNNTVAKPVPVIGSGDQLALYPTSHWMLPDGRWALNPGQENVLENMNSRAKSISRFSEKW